MLLYAKYDYSLTDQHRQHIEANTFTYTVCFSLNINRRFNFNFFVQQTYMTQQKLAVYKIIANNGKEGILCAYTYRKDYVLCVYDCEIYIICEV